MANIVVLGAGVSGLTTALQLIRDNPRHSITVVAKHMPGDYDIEYASPWAGANYLPVGKPGTDNYLYERDTWPELARLARELPEAGVHFQESHVYRRAKDKGSPTAEWFEQLMRPDAWFKDVVPNFRPLRQNELPPGCDGGSTFTSVCINTALYLPWLASRCLRHGVIFRRGTVTHISHAASLHHSNGKADIVVNCTGLASLRLGGVADANVYPARGQIVLVRNTIDCMASTSGTDDGGDEACYIMHRAAGGGTILGGCLQAGNWESQPDPSLAVRIMQRAVALRPDLVAGESGRGMSGADGRARRGIEGLDVVRHGVGLRPMRKGGIRVAKEVVDGVMVVHNYGHGGYGYQASYGAAGRVVGLVNEVVGGAGGGERKARL